MPVFQRIGILFFQAMWLLFCLLLLSLFIKYHESLTKLTSNSNLNSNLNSKLNQLDALQKVCINSFHQPEWWSYILCYKDNIKQVHIHPETKNIEEEHEIGKYVAQLSSKLIHTYQSSTASCMSSNKKVKRTMKVHFKCCDHATTATYKHSDTSTTLDHNYRTFIEVVYEPVPCSYVMQVCSDILCSSKKVLTSPGKHQFNFTTGEMDNINSESYVSPKHQLELRERVRNMFFHGYHSYMDHAFPEGELRPLSCSGSPFELIKLPLVTLIDSLDTLVLMGEYEEFRVAVGVLSAHIRSFDYDINVSVFETTIRILGGLLSAHLMAIDPSLKIYDYVNESYVILLGGRPDLKNYDFNDVEFSIQNDRDLLTSPSQPYTRRRMILPAYLIDQGWPWKLPPNHSNDENSSFNTISNYDNWLLTLAMDLGDRLLPAFQTNTNIPFGTVNLRSGVPRGESEIASTAGAGSLSLEFGVLTRLTGDPRYEEAAFRSSKELFLRKSPAGLVGKHINIKTGHWVETSSGIGSNSDSFYEYLLKSYLLFGHMESYEMFTEAYFAVKRHVQAGDWFGDVDMFHIKNRKNRVESLHCFWPGMESSIGLSSSSTKLLNAFYGVWTDTGFFPEEFDQVSWLNGGKIYGNPYYPLRPELIESTYHQYQTTGDRSWLQAGVRFLESIERHTYTECGYASISNLVDKSLTDDMPSYFLSETCKYLYLLFDEDNFVHKKSYIFSTEAHPFDPLQLISTNADNNLKYPGSKSSFTNEDSVPGDLGIELQDEEDETYEDDDNDSSIDYNRMISTIKGSNEHFADTKISMGLGCIRRLYWDNLASYDSSYIPYTSQESVQARLRVHSYVVKHRLLTMNALLNSIGYRHDDSAEEDLMSFLDERVPDTCRLDEKPTTAMVPTPPASSSVEVNMGRMGMFRVQGFSDGFIVESDMWGDTIEIFNVGQPIVFVSQYASAKRTEPVTYISDRISSHTYSCTLDLVDESGTPVDLEKYSVPLSRLSQPSLATFNMNTGSTGSDLRNIMFKKKFQSKSSQTEKPIVRGFWHRSCSLASYGTMAPFLVVAPLVPAPHKNRELCKPIDSHSDGSSKSIGLGNNLASRLWFWATESLHSSEFNMDDQNKIEVETDSNEDSHVNEGSDKDGKMLYKGSVIMGIRGTCMFEDKSVQAERAGANALIIGNQEDFLFVMSGKRSHLGSVQSNSVKDKREENSSLESPHNSVNIPTVMLTKSDAHDLEEIYGNIMSQSPPRRSDSPTSFRHEYDESVDNSRREDQTVQRSPPLVRIQSDKVSMAIDSEYLGFTDYPKVRMTEMVITVVGSSEWGVVLTNTANMPGMNAGGSSHIGTKEWQLFIISKADLLNPHTLNWFAFSVHGHAINIPQVFTTNGVEMYANHLRQQCPSAISISKSDGKVFVRNGRRF